MKLSKNARFGAPADYTAEMSCGTCNLRDVCRDPSKARQYACSLFQADDIPKEDESARDFSTWMRQLVQSESVLSDPFAIDDRSCELAPNFYSWCMGAEYLNHEPTPFPWQLQVGMKLFSDGCPFCSNQAWYNDIPFDCDPRDIPRKISLRINGRCPRCQRTIVDGINAQRENDVNTFIGIVGQRCVTGDTFVSTPNGPCLISKFFRDDTKFGWSDFSNPIEILLENGETAIATRGWKSTPETIYKLSLSQGQFLCGTGDHPVMTARGWVVLRNLVDTDYVAVCNPKSDPLFYKVHDVAIGAARITYDLHVPEHHRFITNDILSHNSGKCITGDALVPTTRGIIPLRDVLVGDCVLVRGATHPVTMIHKTPRKKIITLKTTYGYSIKCTPEHQVMTPTGWEPAHKAHTVRIRAEMPKRLPTSPYTRSNADTSLKSLLSSPLETAVANLRALVQMESISGLRLVLKVAKKRAYDFQQALLALGIFCVVVDTPDTLFIEQPYATRYLKRVGISNGKVARSIWLGRRLGEKFISAEACRNLVTLISYQKWNTAIAHPGDLRQAQEFHAAAIHRTLTRKHAAASIALVRRIHGTDMFLRNLLIAALEDIKHGNMLWIKVDAHIRKGETADVYDIKVPGITRFIANGVEVHNSTGSSLTLSYQLHRLLKLKNPSEFYGLKRNTLLKTNIVGINYANAKQFVWEPFLDGIKGSPWFLQYHEIMESAAKKRGVEELYRMRDTFLMYRPTALHLAPASPDRRALRGATRIGMVVDELGQFSENSELIRSSGLEIWNSLYNSLVTVRVAVRALRRRGVVAIPPAVAIGISSPRDVADPILVLRKRLLKAPNTYTMLKETWNANPTITREDLVAEGFDDAAIERDFACRPPFSTNPFIEGLDPVRDCVKPDFRPAVRQRTIAGTTKNMRRFVSVQLAWPWSDANVPKVMGLDAGHDKNAFSVAVAHFDELGRIVYDAFVEILPRPRMPVSFEAAYTNVLEPLIQRMNVRVIASDRWQQYAITDRAETNHKTIPVEKRLTYGDFQAWRDDLLHKTLVFPRPEVDYNVITELDEKEDIALADKPVAQFIRQCLRVVDIPGKTVEKPKVGNDDLFRAAVVAHTAMLQPAVLAVLNKGRVNKNAGAIGAASTGSGNVSFIGAKSDAPRSPIGAASGGSLR